ncbi:hypothetical protein F4774DRAFT_372330, partial [Daldinia eschscholtzii]
MRETPDALYLTTLEEATACFLNLNITKINLDQLGLPALRIQLQTKLPLASYPNDPPECFRCGKPTTRHYTSMANRNGNQGRPYFKCMGCNEFLVFADARGNYPTSQLCDCKQSCKLLLTGVNKPIYGRAFYCCRLGTCDTYEPWTDNKGRPVAIDSTLYYELRYLDI